MSKVVRVFNKSLPVQQFCWRQSCDAGGWWTPQRPPSRACCPSPHFTTSAMHRSTLCVKLSTACTTPEATWVGRASPDDKAVANHWSTEALNYSWTMLSYSNCVIQVLKSKPKLDTQQRNTKEVTLVGCPHSVQTHIASKHSVKQHETTHDPPLSKSPTGAFPAFTGPVHDQQLLSIIKMTLQ